MKLCYAFRRATFYPFFAGAAWNIPNDPKTRTEYLGKVNDIGFDGIELGFDAFGGFEATKQRAQEFQSVLEDSGAPCVAIRAGGGLCQPGTAPESRARLEKAVEIAAMDRRRDRQHRTRDTSTRSGSGHRTQRSAVLAWIQRTCH